MTTARPAGASRRADRGQATVELALVLPLVVLVLVAVVQVGLLARDQVLVTHAAREAARAAAVTDDPAAPRRAAEQAGPLRPERLQVTTTGRRGVGSRVRVEVRYRAPIRIPVIDRVIADVELQGTATMRVER